MADLHLWRLALHPARMMAIAREQRIPPCDEDGGFLVHALLCGVFGTAAAPKPWRFDGRRRVVWAYAGHPLPPASVEADPLYVAAVDWERSASRPMPVLRAGQRVAFDVRACPVVRHGGRKGSDRPQEHDWLLWRARRMGVAAGELDPRVEYVAWFRERAWRSEYGAVVEAVQVAGWSKPTVQGANAWRGREEGRLRLPDVTFTGVVVIADPGAFARMLARGIGRHRAFGYGMVLLRSVGG